MAFIRVRTDWPNAVDVGAVIWFCSSQVVPAGHSWVGPSMFKRMLERELGGVRLHEHF
jgi:hypothetical protein